MTAADKIPQHRKKIAGKATNMQMANCPVPRTLETGQGTNPCIRHDEYPTTSKAIAMSQNSRRTPSHFFISRPFSLTNRRSAAGKIRCPSTGPYSSAASSPPLRAAASASPSVFWFSQVPWHPRFCQHYTKSPSSRIVAHRGKSARNRGSVAPRRTAPPDSKSAPLSPHCSVAERRSPLQYVTG